MKTSAHPQTLVSKKVDGVQWSLIARVLLACAQILFVFFGLHPWTLHAQDPIIYQNQRNPLVSAISWETREHGDEIGLIPGKWRISELTVRYSADFPTTTRAQVILRLYRKDGPFILLPPIKKTRTPGAKIWESAPIDLARGDHSLTVPLPPEILAKDAIWTAEFLGVQQTAGNFAGLILATRPTAGAGYRDIWIRERPVAGGRWGVHFLIPNGDSSFFAEIRGQFVAPTSVVPTIDKQLTNSPRPTITGTVTIQPGESFRVGLRDQFFTTNSGVRLVGNTWSLAAPFDLPIGVHEIDAEIVDAWGNICGDVTRQELVIAPIPPTTPTVEPLVTRDSTPTLTGAAQFTPADVFTIEVANRVFQPGPELQVGGGRWSLTPERPIPDGVYDVKARIQDPFGNVATDASTQELLIDSTPPLPPFVSELFTRETRPTLVGVATVGAGEQLTVTLDGVTYTPSNGLILLGDLWLLVNPSPLKDGVYSVTAQITDFAGNTVTDPTENELRIDSTPPNAPTVDPQWTAESKPRITGKWTPEPSAVLSVAVGGVAYRVGSGLVVAGAQWSLTPARPLADGTYDVQASATDAAGNLALDTTGNELLIDTQRPPAPTVRTVRSRDLRPIISGEVFLGAGDTFAVDFAGRTYTESSGLSVQGGRWEFRPEEPLVEGVHEVVAAVTDLVGNFAIDTSRGEVTIDITPPPAPTVAALATRDPRPLLSGAAILGSQDRFRLELNGIVYERGNGVILGDGEWSFKVPISLPDGVYSITASVEDDVGNRSVDATASELLIDTTAPSRPTVLAVRTASKRPTLRGGAELAVTDRLRVEVAGEVYEEGNGLLRTGSEWALTVRQDLSEGRYDVVATALDSLGNSITDGTIEELVVDFTPPQRPVVVSQVTNQSRPIVSGTAIVQVGEALTVGIAGADYGVGSGLEIEGTVWRVEIGTPLNDGVYEVVARTRDGFGNESIDSSEKELVIDTTPPAAPTVDRLLGATPRPVLTGSANLGSGETLTVEVAGVVYRAGAGVEWTPGRWTLRLNTDLSEGVHDVAARVVDVAGNAATDATSGEIVLDFTPPAPATVTIMTTSNPRPVLFGSVLLDPGDTFRLEVNGSMYFVNAGIVIAGGQWSFQLPTTLGEGSYDVTAWVVDPAGNATEDPTFGELTVDLSAPPVPTVSFLETRVNPPTLTGTAVLGPADKLQVEVGGRQYQSGIDVVLIGNTWSVVLKDPLAEGRFDVVVRSIDSVGNVATDATRDELLIDTTPPARPVVRPLLTRELRPTLTGRAELKLGERLEVAVAAKTYAVGAGLSFDGDEWSLVPVDALNEGAYEVVARAVDGAGNVATDDSILELVVDRTPPVTPTVERLATRERRPVLRGAADLREGDRLTVRLNGVAYPPSGALIWEGGLWRLTPTAPLDDGVYEIEAQVTDAAGNVAADPTLNELLVDTQAPVIPSVESLVASSPRPRIQGGAVREPGGRVIVTVGGRTYSEGDGLTWENDRWVLNLGADLADGVYDVLVVLEDAVGNSSSDRTSDELRVDTRAPSTPVVAPLLTRESKPVITGTATLEPGDRLQVTVAGVTYETGKGLEVTGTSWRLALPVALADGAYDVVVLAEDVAGNRSIDGSRNELRIDTAPPRPPEVTRFNTRLARPTLGGGVFLEVGETLQVRLNGRTYRVGEGLEIAGSSWTLIPVEDLPDGRYDVVATVVDEAGNAAVDGSVDEVLVDRTPPLTPTVRTLRTSKNRPTVEGAAQLGLGENLEVIVAGIRYTSATGLNVAGTNWSIAVPTALADGTHDVLVRVTDAVGNVAEDASAGELFIDATPPQAPVVVQMRTNQTRPTVRGTAIVRSDETLEVQVNGIRYAVGAGLTVTGSEWVASVSVAFGEGAYDVDAVVVDSVGNSTSDGTVKEVVIDLTPPSAPAVEPLRTEELRPRISGVAALQAGDVLTVTVAGRSYTRSAGLDWESGRWSLTVANDLDEGVHEVEAVVVDEAGNRAVDATRGELIIEPPIAEAVDFLISGDLKSSFLPPIRIFLAAMDVSAREVDMSRLTAGRLTSARALLWLSSPGVSPGNELARRLHEFHAGGMACYFLGDGLIQAFSTLDAGGRDAWAQLLKVSPAPSKASRSDPTLFHGLGNSPLNGFFGVVSELPQTALLSGAAGIGFGETVLGRSDENDILVAYDQGDGWSLTQSWTPRFSGNELTTDGYNLLFSNAIWWLLSRPMCTAFGINMEAESLEAPVKAGSEATLRARIRQSGECPAYGLKLFPTLAAGAVVTETLSSRPGRWRSRDGATWFEVSTLPNGGEVEIEFKVRFDLAGVATHTFRVTTLGNSGLVEQGVLEYPVEVAGVAPGPGLLSWEPGILEGATPALRLRGTVGAGYRIESSRDWASWNLVREIVGVGEAGVRIELVRPSQAGGVFYRAIPGAR